MCTCTSASLDRSKTTAFGEKLGQIINHAALALMTSIGHRTRLFDTMSKLDWSTSDQIASAASLNERYVREWLGAMVTGGFVDYDPAARTYHLPPEHAACLTRSAAPNNMAVTAQWISILGSVEDQVVDAFTHGRGVPYSAYNRFHQVMAEESAQTVVAGMFDHILPLVPGLADRLQHGIDVLDIGCGAGQAMIALAGAFPRSRFAGYDFSKEAIAAANDRAKSQGLSNIRFIAKDVAEISDAGAFDLITAFDAIHDQARPDRVLSNIARALRPGGFFLMQDILARTHVHDNKDNPIAPFVYTISTMHCMSVSLANGGPGLGAAWGKEKAIEMLDAAGFRDVRVEQLPHDPLNYYYIARPAR